MPSDNITICGRGFDIPVPDRYTAGSTIELTEGEASSIRQTFCENIRNNIAARMKKDNGAVNEAGALHEELVEEWQTKVNEYAESYQFGVRTGGGGRTPADPVERETLKIVKDKIREKLVRLFGAKHGHTTEQVNELAAQLMATDRADVYRTLAKQRIAQLNEAADIELTGMDVPAEAA